MVSKPVPVDPVAPSCPIWGLDAIDQCSSGYPVAKECILKYFENSICCLKVSSTSFFPKRQFDHFWAPVTDHYVHFNGVAGRTARPYHTKWHIFRKRRSSSFQNGAQVVGRCKKRTLRVPNSNGGVIALDAKKDAKK